MRLQGQTVSGYRVLDALELAVVMRATQVIWFLIPSVAVLGSGLFTAYSQLLGSWAPWASLWPLDAVLLGGSVWLVIRLAHEEDHSRRPARPLGRTPCIVSAFCVRVAIGAVTVTALVQRACSLRCTEQPVGQR